MGYLIQAPFSSKQSANPNEMGLSVSIVLLSIIGIKLIMASTIVNCRRPYDCTSNENHLVSYFSRVSFFACAAKCQDEPLCEHFTFNMDRHGHYPGACYLFASCSVQRPSNGQWVSAAKSCISPTTSPLQQAKYTWKRVITKHTSSSTRCD